jgi:hypothetical protein
MKSISRVTINGKVLKNYGIIHINTQPEQVHGLATEPVQL